MNILMLDIDGVLNSERYFSAHPGMPFSFAEAELLNHFDPEACARLQRILTASRAKIILSSSWRIFVKPTEMERLLHSRGVTAAEIVGETPRLPREGLDAPLWSPRGAEIQEWIHQNAVLPSDRLVILDDAHVGEALYPYQVHTDHATGLLDPHVEMALTLLGERK